MVTVVGVRFKDVGKIYYFDPHDLDIEKGDNVIVETIRGLEYGNVVIGKRDLSIDEVILPLKPVLRIASEEDDQANEANIMDAEEAFHICEDKIGEHGLDMRLIDSEFTFDRNKLIFYFIAEGRIDFRELVKDLASIFKTRIELRQIGVRDQAKLTGGLGPCGQEICCAKFLGDFEPVSIKMAKEQDLSLNPSKISGLCGRLMCCLNYEEEVYQELNAKMPRIGSRVNTPDGPGIVVDLYKLLEKVKVRIRLPEDLEDIITYDLEEVEEIRENKCKTCPKSCAGQIDEENLEIIEESQEEVIEEN